MKKQKNISHGTYEKDIEDKNKRTKRFERNKRNDGMKRKKNYIEFKVVAEYTKRKRKKKKNSMAHTVRQKQHEGNVKAETKT